MASYKILYFILITIFFPNINGSLNLYMDGRDAKKLLGVNSEIWYVREGEVKNYALQFRMPVSANINKLTFHWQSLHRTVMPYNVSVLVGDYEALHQPQLSIKKRGLVPSKSSTWTVILNCTGKRNTEIDVDIILQLPMKDNLDQITTLTIQRKKICYKDDRNGEVYKSAMEIKNSTTAVYITIGLLAIFLILVASLAAINHIRSSKLRARQAQGNFGRGVSREGLPNNQRGIGKASQSSLSEIRRSPQATNTTSATTTTTTAASPEPHCSDPRLGDVASKISGLKAELETVTLLELEMEGTFGRIHQGIYRPAGDDATRQVWIKTISECASKVQRNVFLSEGSMLVGLQHDNILSLLAAVVPEEQPPILVFSHSSQGNLKKFLQSCHTLLTKEVVGMGVQVLQALAFLHSKLLLHKDVATRNCVIDEGLHIKLTDCALSRDLFSGDYHCLGDNENRPVKWLALESLSHKVFSPSSDVWSWGVLLWEIMTLGQQPYVEIDPFEVSNILRQGVRLAQPINCPDEMFKAMTFCWTTAPSERPTVDELIAYLNNFLQHLDRYV